MNEFLFRRTPDWDKELSRDRFPKDYSYIGLYPTVPWEAFTGTTHTWDKVHVTEPNDTGCWDTMDATTWTSADCAKQNMCDPNRLQVGWGSTRATYSKQHQDYQTPVFCLDRIRNVEEAQAQVGAIIEGLKKLPEAIVSNWIKVNALKGADFIHICGSSFTKVTVSDSIFTNQCMKIALGSNSNVPTSKLTMQYLNHFVPSLFYQGYDKNQFSPQAQVEMMCDITTMMELCNANPALTMMYNSADFAKGGKFFAFGAMMGCGNFLFHVDPMPLRFYHIGGGVMQRIFPYQNVSATLGLKPQFDPNYEAAPYQLYHIYSRGARKVSTGQMAQVSPEMPFGSNRDFMGKWSWKSPDVILYTDPNTGGQCTYRNDKKNRGYFLGEYELALKSEFPAIEMWIMALRESTPVADVPRVQTVVFPTTTPYQSLTPYLGGCDTTEEV